MNKLIIILLFIITLNSFGQKSLFTDPIESGIRDKSIRKNIQSGEVTKIPITVDSFVQIKFLRYGKIVYPIRIIAGSPELLIITKDEKSPYLYIQAREMLEGANTSLHVETEEDGRIQTYVLFLEVVKPQYVRYEVIVNLERDLTPLPNYTPQPINTMVASFETQQNKEDTNIQSIYLTMVEMSKNYETSKKIEQSTGKQIYSEKDIILGKTNVRSYKNPLDGSIWTIEKLWGFPKYDTIMIETTVKNTKIQDFTKIRWRIKNSPLFKTTGSVIEPNGKIWFFLKGYGLQPEGEFYPVFPKP